MKQSISKTLFKARALAYFRRVERTKQPLVITETVDKFDVLVRVSGGGPAGQAGALRHGIARALLEYNPELRGKLFLPLLGRPLEEALDRGEIVPVQCDGSDYLRYGDLLLPARGTDPRQQAYRLGWWRAASGAGRRRA